jgi:hypothetical protein
MLKDGQEKKGVEDRFARGYIYKPENPNLGKFWRVLQWKILVGIFYGYIFGQFSVHLVYFITRLVYFMVIWYMFPVFGIFYHEKSGNPG